MLGTQHLITMAGIDRSDIAGTVLTVIHTMVDITHPTILTITGVTQATDMVDIMAVTMEATIMVTTADITMATTTVTGMVIQTDMPMAAEATTTTITITTMDIVEVLAPTPIRKAVALSTRHTWAMEKVLLQQVAVQLD